MRDAPPLMTGRYAGALLASGRDADVFELDETRVLRRYRSGGDSAPESVVMAHVAAAGYPVPAVYAVEGPDLVLERLDGETMLRALLAGRLDIDTGMAVLVELQARLHTLPVWLGARPTDRILHLDLHPLNIMLTSRGPVVIDWRNAREGPPDLDVAMTALIFAEVALGPDVNVAPAARAGLDAFQSRVRPPRRSQLRRAVAMRRADPALTAGEVGALRRAAALVRTAQD